MAPKRKYKKRVKGKIKNSRNRKKDILITSKENKPNIFLENTMNLARVTAKAPFLLINLLINNFILFVKVLYNKILQIIKNTLSVFSNFKEAFFGITFGLLSGGIGAVVIFSYLDFNIANKNTEYENKIIDNTKLISKQKKQLDENTISIEQFTELINNLNTELQKVNEIILDNNSNLTEYSKKIKELYEITKSTSDKFLLSEEQSQNKILELEKKIQNTSTILLSSSKSELSNRLYLAQSLLDRLNSGVPYDPQLVALGKEGLHPALLRFAKGGAPTLSDLTARLTVRAGELRDAYKTKSDSSWKNNLKDEISKFVKIKPTDSSNIKGMEGVLLRAEEAISKGDLETAILEIDSLDIESRGVLNAWLSEAKAKKNASIAAENLLARTTAALKNKN